MCVVLDQPYQNAQAAPYDKTMRQIFCVGALLLACVWITGCAGPRAANYQVQALTPAPEKPIDPPDIYVVKAIEKFLKDSEAPQASRYEFSRFDLDADGRRDALVLFKNPYGYWCGMHGCTMLVLKAHNKSFELVNGIQPIREPLYVSDNETNGWKDLVVRVSGRWDKSKDVALRYDGKNYPNNPSNLPAYLRYASQDRVKIFYE